MFRNTKTGRTYRRFGAAHALALVALFVALGGGAYAAAKIDTGDLASKAVTKKKLAKAAVATNRIADGAVTTEKIADLGVTPDKLEHRSYWAVAGPGSNLIRGLGATEVVRVNAGNYRVGFGTDISQCSYQVTGLDVNENLIGHADDAVTDNTFVFVSLRNTAGTRTDGEFNLAAHC